MVVEVNVLSGDYNRRTMLREGLLFGLGNPLLDITVESDEEFLKKYKMNPNDAILGGNDQRNLSQDIVSTYHHVEYSAGGSCLNTARIAQWLLGVPRVIVNTGCIGDDSFGRILQQKAIEAGVDVQFQIDKQEPTGTCAVLVTDKHRSLCAFLHAAQCFQQSHLRDPDIKEKIANARYFYTTGYFLVVSLPSLLEVAEHALQQNKTFMFNISAGYVCESFKESVEKLLPYIDIVFGNDQEFTAFSHAFSLNTTDMHEVARKVAAMPKLNSSRRRIVIITRGPEPAFVCHDGNTIDEYSAHKLTDAEIINTNGAGDGFVGGFISQFIQEYPLSRCMDCGHYAAAEVIKQPGVSVPPVPNFIYTG